MGQIANQKVIELFFKMKRKKKNKRRERKKRESKEKTNSLNDKQSTHF